MATTRLTLEERAEQLAVKRADRRTKRTRRPMRVSGKRVFELQRIITRKGRKD